MRHCTVKVPLWKTVDSAAAGTNWHENLLKKRFLTGDKMEELQWAEVAGQNNVQEGCRKMFVFKYI